MVSPSSGLHSEWQVKKSRNSGHRGQTHLSNLSHTHSRCPCGRSVPLEELVAHCPSGCAKDGDTGSCWKQAWVRVPQMWPSVVVLTVIKIKSPCVKVVTEKKLLRHLVQPAQESFLPYVSTTFSPKSWGSRGHRAAHSLEAAVLGEEESHGHFLALAFSPLESLPSTGCLWAQWGTGEMFCMFSCWPLAGSHVPVLGIGVLEQTSDAICDPQQQKPETWT